MYSRQQYVRLPGTGRERNATTPFFLLCSTCSRTNSNVNWEAAEQVTKETKGPVPQSALQTWVWYWLQFWRGCTQHTSKEASFSMTTAALHLPNLYWPTRTLQEHPTGLLLSVNHWGVASVGLTTETHLGYSQTWPQRANKSYFPLGTHMSFSSCTVPLESNYLYPLSQIENFVLVVAGTELNFFAVVCIGLCFGFLLEIVSITRWCLRNCGAVLAQCWGLLCSSPPPPASRLGAQKAGRGHSQDTRPRLTKVQSTPYDVMLSNKSGGKKEKTGWLSERRCLSPQVSAAGDGALLSWRWLNTCPPVGSHEWIPYFALLAYTAFAVPVKLSLSQPRSSYLCPFDCPPHSRPTGGKWLRGCAGLSCHPGLSHSRLVGAESLTGFYFHRTHPRLKHSKVTQDSHTAQVTFPWNIC